MSNPLNKGREPNWATGSPGLTTCGQPQLKLLLLSLFYDLGLRPISGPGCRKLQPNLAPTPNIFQLLLEIFYTEHTDRHFAVKWILMRMRCSDAKYTEENYATKDSSGMCHLMQQFHLPEHRGDRGGGSGPSTFHFSDGGAWPLHFFDRPVLK